VVRALALADAGGNGRIRLEAHVDGRAAEIGAAQGRVEEDGAPDFEIVRRLRRFCDGANAATLIAAIALGRRRTTVTLLARAVGRTSRSLEYQLKERCGLTPRQLLGWSLGLHTIWRLEVLGLSMKRCAGLADYSDAEALARYIMRYTGSRPTTLLRDGGFTKVLDTFSTLLGLAAFATRPGDHPSRHGAFASARESPRPVSGTAVISSASSPHASRGSSAPALPRWLSPWEADQHLTSILKDT
jgi:hypothetical protein